jgi:hypothetical protein
MTESQRAGQEAADPGAYVGSEPEREAETIPGGIGSKDQRISASDSRPGADGEPEDDGDTSDVVTGEIGSASLKEPGDTEHNAADLDQLAAKQGD